MDTESLLQFLNALNASGGAIPPAEEAPAIPEPGFGFGPIATPLPSPEAEALVPPASGVSPPPASVDIKPLGSPENPITPLGTPENPIGGLSAFANSGKPAIPRSSPEDLAQRQATLAVPPLPARESSLKGMSQTRADLQRANNDELKATAISEKAAVDQAQREGLTEAANLQAEADLKDERAKKEAALQEAATRVAINDWMDWQKKVQALRTEEDPRRYWKNTSGFGKAMWLVALAAGGYSGKGDSILNMINAEIDRDIGAQRSTFANQKAQLSAEGEALEKLTGLRRQQVLDLHAQYDMRLEALIKANAAKMKTVANDDKAKLSAYAGVQTKLLGLRSTKEKEAFDAIHKEMQTRATYVGLGIERDRLNEQVAARKAAEKAAKEVKGAYLNPDLGPVLSNGANVPIRNDKETVAHANKTAASYQDQYNTMLDLLEDLKSGGTLTKFVGSNKQQADLGELLMAKMAEGGAKSLSDAEGKQFFMSILGQDGVNALANMRPGDAAEVIQRKLDNMPEKFNRAISVDRADVGPVGAPPPMRVILRDTRAKPATTPTSGEQVDSFEKKAGNLTDEGRQPVKVDLPGLGDSVPISAFGIPGVSGVSPEQQKVVDDLTLNGERPDMLARVGKASLAQRGQALQRAFDNKDISLDAYELGRERLSRAAGVLKGVNPEHILPWDESDADIRARAEEIRKMLHGD